MSPTIHSTKHRMPRGGFSLVEATIAIALVSFVLVAALSALGATTRARQIQSRAGVGHALARALMTEIIATEYAEPVDTPTFGREAGENAATRAMWDDVDDYHLWSASPPVDRSGTPVLGAEGWKRTVTVGYVDPVTLVPSGGLTDTTLKRVTVIAISPAGEQTMFEGLRSAVAAPPAPVEATKYIAEVSVEIQIDGAAAPARSTGLVNDVVEVPPP